MKGNEMRESLEQVIAGLQPVEAVESSFRLLADLLVVSVPGCMWAAVSAVEPARVETTDRPAADLEEIQMRLGLGPSLDAIRQSRPVVGHLSAVDDWAPLADMAGRLGVRSALCAPAVHGSTPLGVVSLYADRVDAFRDGDELVATSVARLMARTLAQERRLAETAELVADLVDRIDRDDSARSDGNAG